MEEYKADKTTCPVCKGKGYLELPRTLNKNKFDNETRREMARTLHKAGYSYRQIGKFLGWKSSWCPVIGCKNVRAKKPNGKRKNLCQNHQKQRSSGKIIVY